MISQLRYRLAAVLMCVVCAWLLAAGCDALGLGGGTGGMGGAEAQADWSALAQVDPVERALKDGVADYAAQDCEYLVQANMPDPENPDATLEDDLFAQYYPQADADAEAWAEQVDVSTLQSGPLDPMDRKCLDPPYSCKVGEVCPYGDGVYCLLKTCAKGSCPKCSAWFGNLVYDGYCTYDMGSG